MAYGYIDNKGNFVTPDVVEYKGEALYEPTEEILAELGYLKRTETLPPSDGRRYVPYYIEKDLKAIQCWRLEPEPGATDAERIAELEATINALLGVSE